MGFIDLHAHTTESDGSMKPAELIRHANSRGLTAIAVTDHDTMAGLPEALEEGKRLGIEVIPGVEISTDFEPEMHILGYFPHGGHEKLAKLLSGQREKRDIRNPRIINKLNELGVMIDMEEVEAYAEGGVVGRPHIAQAMINNGYVESMQEAFDKYLAAGKPAYFKKDKLTPEEGIGEITAAGGIPVLAHPIHLNRTMSELDTLFGKLKDAGLKGIEAIYSENTEEQTLQLLDMAKKHGLLATGGSDFHGLYRPEMEIGVGRGNLAIGEDVLDRLKSFDS